LAIDVVLTIAQMLNKKADNLNFMEVIENSIKWFTWYINELCKSIKDPEKK
jgi:hypothetical protein